MASRAQATVTVHALSAGYLTLPERFFVAPSSPTAILTVPSLAFLIQHTSHTELPKTTRLLFDLGLRRDPATYSAPIRKHILTRKPMSTNPDVVASLAAGGLTPDEIDYIIFSHVHWDHIGTPSDFQAPHTRFIVGPGSLDLLNGTNKASVGSHSHFEKDLLPLERTIELPGIDAGCTAQQKKLSSTTTPSGHTGVNFTPWQPLTSTLPHTVDLFGDGSLYIIHAPGHLPGHINLLARTGPGKSVYLAGDACHDIRLFDGTRGIATWTDDAGNACCIHVDRVEAEETIGRIRELARGGEVEVVFAHNAEWEAKAREEGRFWPGRL